MCIVCILYHFKDKLTQLTSLFSLPYTSPKKGKEEGINIGSDWYWLSPLQEFGVQTERLYILPNIHKWYLQCNHDHSAASLSSLSIRF